MPGTIGLICAQDLVAQVPHIQQTAGLSNKIQIFRSRSWHYESWNPWFLLSLHGVLPGTRCELYQVVLCSHAASPDWLPSAYFPRCGDAPCPARHPASHVPAALDLCVALIRNAELQAGRCCLAAGGIPHQRQPDSSAFLSRVGGLVPHSAGTHPALRLQGGSMSTMLASSQPSPPHGSLITQRVVIPLTCGVCFEWPTTREARGRNVQTR